MHDDNPKKPPYAILVKKKKAIENGIEVSVLQTHTQAIIFKS